MTDQPTARLVHAPWNAEQVTALNAFQHTGRMHPFTCGAEHASGQSPMLVATNGGWVCPDPQCTYRQDWAHAFMAVPAVPVSSPPPDQTAEPVCKFEEGCHRVVPCDPGCAVAAAELHHRLAAVPPPPADRAAVLQWAADFAEQLMDERYGPDCSYGIGGLDVARELRRLAAEAQQPDTETRP